MAGTRGRSGGRRSGAGRKPKAEKHLTPIQAAERRIADRLPSLIDNLFRLADGVMLQKTDRDGGVDVFTTPPDRQANEYLINRVMGKPTDRHEHTGGNGGPVEVDVTLKGRAEKELDEWRREQQTKLSSFSSVPPTAPTSSTPAAG